MGELLCCETYQDKMSVNVVALLVGIDTTCQPILITHMVTLLKGAGFVTRIQLTV